MTEEETQSGGFASPWNRQPFTLGNWVVEPARHRLKSSTGTEVHLQPKVMRLLCVLADQAGTTVSREDLVKQVWGGLSISEAAIDRAVCNLRKAFGDDAKAPCFFETVRKRGIRLMILPQKTEAPTIVQPVMPQAAEVAWSLNGAPGKGFRTSVVLAFIALAVLALFTNFGSPAGASGGTGIVAASPAPEPDLVIPASFSEDQDATCIVPASQTVRIVMSET